MNKEERDDYMSKAYRKMNNLSEYIRERSEKTIVTNTGGYIQIKRPRDEDLDCMKDIK